MAFSLSPSVQVREFDLAQNVPNLPSSKTGMVLRADTGPMFKIVSITNESELTGTFGKPTTENYQDWFQAWNFLQYAASLYVVRAGKADKTTKNAGCGLTGSTVVNTDATTNFANFYNKDVAENSLPNIVGSQKLYLINKNVTSVQDLAFGICSSKKFYNSQIGLEYFGVVASGGAVGSTSVTATGTPSLIKGSKIVLNDNKLVEVQSIQQGSGTATIVFDRAVSATDVTPFYATVAASSSVALSVVVNKEGCTLKRGVAVSEAGANFYVDSVASNSDDPSTYVVTFIKSSGGGASGLSFAANAKITSSEMLYFANTAYNSARNDFGVNAGATELELQAGFVIEEGVTFSLVGDTVTVPGLVVSTVDNVSHKIKLSKPVSAAVAASASKALTITSSMVTPQLIVGINNLNLVYDEGTIVKTRQTVTALVNGSVVTTTVLVEKLIAFDRLVEFEPVWSKDEFLVVFLKKNADGKYAILDKALVSYIVGGRDSNGRNNFVEEVFFSNAKIPVYAKVGDVTSASVDTAMTSLAKILGNTSPTGSDTVYPLSTTNLFTAEYDGTGYVQADVMAAQDLFADPESFDINRLITHELDMNGMSAISNSRKDCRAIVAPYDYVYLSTSANSDATTFMLERFGTQTPYANKTFSEFNTYATIYGNMKYQYDKFNDVNRWICVAGDVAGLFAQTNANRDPWWATAGSQRGVIKNVIKLAFNPNKQNRGDLYVNAINPIINIPGEGNGVIYGQKTATAIASAFDRNNVRDLMIFLEKAIATSARTGLFEFNDAFTRQRLFSMIDPFLRTVKARRGLYDYKLIIDSSNNNAEVIDANGLVIDIYLKPTKVAEFIQINAVVVKTGVSFTEVVGRF